MGEKHVKTVKGISSRKREMFLEKIYIFIVRK